MNLVAGIVLLLLLVQETFCNKPRG
jgi:hypothetical protein